MRPTSKVAQLHTAGTHPATHASCCCRAACWGLRPGFNPQALNPGCCCRPHDGAHGWCFDVYKEWLCLLCWWCGGTIRFRHCNCEGPHRALIVSKAHACMFVIHRTLVSPPVRACVYLSQCRIYVAPVTFPWLVLCCRSAASAQQRLGCRVAIQGSKGGVQEGCGARVWGRCPMAQSSVPLYVSSHTEARSAQCLPHVCVHCGCVYTKVTQLPARRQHTVLLFSICIKAPSTPLVHAQCRCTMPPIVLPATVSLVWRRGAAFVTVRRFVSYLLTTSRGRRALWPP